MGFNEDELKLLWIKILLLSIKTSDKDNKDIKKREEASELGEENSM